ncbi:hypothetical protein LPB140_01775 [Sphingorhabdus lutea]|uniref:DUF2007 domain-containing protein n=1 Tax=Sphingorhabdus lutea TaxID=1913578 RepID=A0A1L3J9F6_9SPHN|nr:DUF2007 domain-containing protein [Sphingorhabdus lutea]APG61766.1 hypothetical protein LPB140_01775 [Sphingorhabdus lutea]
MSLVELARFPTKIKADICKSFLQSHEIMSVIFDDGMNNFFGGGGLIAVKLMVLDEDHDEAASLLAKAELL